MPDSSSLEKEELNELFILAFGFLNIFKTDEPNYNLNDR
jgi:hypothetical protein